MRPRLSFRDRVYLTFLLIVEATIVGVIVRYWWKACA